MVNPDPVVSRALPLDVFIVAANAPAEIMREYARQRGLRRTVVPTPLATRRLSRWFLSIATPVYGQIAATMIDSMRNETTVHSNRAYELFELRPRGLREAIERALRNEDHEYAETRWSDALLIEVDRWGGAGVGHRRVFTRSLQVVWRPRQAFAAATVLILAFCASQSSVLSLRSLAFILSSVPCFVKRARIASADSPPWLAICSSSCVIPGAGATRPT